MQSNPQNHRQGQNFALLWKFLHGAKRYFLISMLAAGVTALADMLQPQIIRAAIDCAIGGQEGNFPDFVQRSVDRIGGFSYLGENLWIMALAVILVAMFKVVSQYSFRVNNTKAAETLVKGMRDQLFSHIERLPFSWHMLNRTGDIIQRCTSDILSGIQVMLVVIFGAVFCVSGHLTAGEYIAFISYNSILVWPIRQLGRMISEMSKAGVSLERVAYILDSPVEQDDPEAVDAPMDGDICFEHVNFSYENAPQMLHDINFTMKAGTTLGILGGTGSGKSTMMLLLDKLYLLEENGGRITIGGTDIRKIRTEHLRRNIGMVLQEPFLFSRTIAENIGIVSPRLDMEAIRAAAAAAALDDSITSFASGYDTMVGERGVTLSGGQKQRAAIARMLTQDVPIMIFDDSLSAVDTQTDARIRQAISRKFGKASVILISHRITTLSSADKILVLDKGRIVEEGTHEQLKRGGGIYQKIYETQGGAMEVMDE